MENAILQRRAVRKYTADPVSQGEIDQLEAAFQASPCGMHQMDVMQGIIVVNADLRKQIEDATDNSCYGAPLLFVLLVNKDSQFGDRDASAAAENIMVQASSLGLGSVYVMSGALKLNSQADLLAKLQVPDGFVVSTIVAVGHIDGKVEAEDRSQRYQCRQI